MTWIFCPKLEILKRTIYILRKWKHLEMKEYLENILWRFALSYFHLAIPRIVLIFIPLSNHLIKLKIGSFSFILITSLSITSQCDEWSKRSHGIHCDDGEAFDIFTGNYISFLRKQLPNEPNAVFSKVARFQCIMNMKVSFCYTKMSDNS